LAESLSGAGVVAVSPARRSGNNRLYRVDTAQGPLALKLYPRLAGDARDRLGAEFGALSFLVRHGVQDVPQALGKDVSAGAGLYGWVDGGVVGPPTDADLDALAAFACRLKMLSSEPDAFRLPLASEACLSADELIAQVERRFARLHEISGHPELSGFLEREVAPVLAAASVAARAAIASGRELPRDLWTLSPSDFGFHNALRQGDGRLVFLDFEYFGWDDPVKLAADVLLHPGMGLDRDQGRRFLAGLDPLRAGDDGFSQRLSAVLPLYALRWCMIVLNEFLPERWARRLAAGEDGAGADVRSRQLAKAYGLLARAADML
jgi:Ser/Thr protein kinase RdoA (MazF antagonist)